MCGRAAALADPHAVGRAVGLPRDPPVRRIHRFRRGDNTHPGQNLPVLYCPGENIESAEIGAMVWGLHPSFSKPEVKPNFFRMFNARVEGVGTSGVFKRLLKQKRCVVAVAGFYEWKLDALKQKQPYYVHYSDNRPMLMAALYDRARLPASFERSPSDTEEDDPDHLYSFTIITMDSSERLAWLHDRMPAVVSPELARRWADPSVPWEEVLPEVSRPNNSADIVWHPVSKKMNTIKYEGGDCTRPVELQTASTGTPPKGGIAAFFKPDAGGGAAASGAAGTPSGPLSKKGKGGAKEEAAEGDDSGSESGGSAGAQQPQRPPRGTKAAPAKRKAGGTVRTKAAAKKQKRGAGGATPRAPATAVSTDDKVEGEGADDAEEAVREVARLQQEAEAEFERQMAEALRRSATGEDNVVARAD